MGLLDPALIDVLFTGDSEIDPFMGFDLTAAQIAEYWQRFGPELRAEQKRRGIAQQCEKEH